MKKSSIFLFIIFFVSLKVSAQITYMVKDISPCTLPSHSGHYTKSGSLVYFSADDGKSGLELWRTDGTASGTFMVKDIVSGSGDGVGSYWGDEYYCDVNGTLFFLAQDANSDDQLWKTNGTSSGTMQLTSESGGIGIDEPMVNMNGVLYFFTGRQLWKSNGTLGGTLMVKDNLATAGNSPYKKPTVVNNLFFFVGYDPVNGYELWKSDGSANGTVMVKDINPGSSDAFTGGYNSFDPCFSNINGVLYFMAYDGKDGTEPWKSNGTSSGTVQIKNIYPSSNPNPLGYNFGRPGFTLFNGEVYFAANDSIHGIELWKTDGTTSGTSLFRDLNTNANLSSLPGHFTIFNNMLYFDNVNFVTGQAGSSTQFWKTDGTLAGTSLEFSSDFSSDAVKDILVIGNNMYLSVIDSSANWVLLKANATPGPFKLLKDIKKSNDDYILNLTALNGNIIFSAKDSLHDQEIWISDGTTSGTNMMKDINDNGDSYIDQLADVNSRLFFSASDYTHGGELWKSNGNSRGTNMVLDANLQGNSNPYYTINYKNKLYYRGGSGGLWSSDGTPAGTVLVTNKVRNIYDVKVMDNELYLSNGSDIWKSDGTDSGTQSIYSGYANDFLKVGKNDLFVDYMGALTKVDLTTKITSQLHSFNYYCSNFTKLNDTLYFLGVEWGYDTLWLDSVTYFTTPIRDHSLWASDGTVSGTKMVSSGDFNQLIMMNNSLYVSGEKNGIWGLYSTNSSYQDLTLIKEIIPGGYAFCYDFFVVDSTLYFTADDNINGIELWKSDGMAGGTKIVKDINPMGSSSPSNFAEYHGALYFSADNGTNGRELWKTDGLVTSLVADINPGGSSNPEKLTVSGDYIYFVADDGISGKELWAHSISTDINCFASYVVAFDSIHNNFNLIVDSLTSSEAINYFWDFGDGTTSTLSNPVHVYAADTVYDVCLKIYTNTGDSCSYCQKIGKDYQGNIIYKTAGFTLSVLNNTIVSDVKKDENRYLVFPNPSAGRAEIFGDRALKDALVRVLNLEGQVIFQRENITGKSFGIDISGQAVGLYFVEIRETDYVSRVKLVKF